MDTKSKNSRKFGILILILLLAASSAVMMLQYGTIRRQIESVQEEGSRSGETAADMANTLAEGNYLLYNRYVRDTDPAEVLSLYGQQRFDLAEKYLDYELIDSKDEVIASDLPEEELKCPIKRPSSFKPDGLLKIRRVGLWHKGCFFVYTK